MMQLKKCRCYGEILQAYPKLGQLQGKLNKGVRACPALLDQAFPKLSKQMAMKVHVIGYLLGREVRRFNDILALREGTKVS